MSDPLIRFLLASGVIALAAVAARVLKNYFNSPELPTRFDRRDASAGKRRALLVQFTTPWCIECKKVLPVLQEASRANGAELAVIDAKQSPAIVAKYRIRSTPTILVVDRKGVVTSAWNSSPSENELTEALQLASVK